MAVMSVWLVGVCVWAVVAVLAVVVTCALRGEDGFNRPHAGVFAFGHNRKMQCAMQQKQTTEIIASPNRPPVSGRSRLRGRRRSGSRSRSPATVLPGGVVVLRQRVAVIGAGPAGASAARQLAERGHTVVVFEAADDVGGRTYSLSRPGYHLFDSGAGFFTNFYPLLSHYIDALNLRSQVMELTRANMFVHCATAKRYLLRLGVGGLLRHPFVTLWSKLRFALYSVYLFARRTSLDVVDPWVLAKHDTASVAESATASVGASAYANIVRPLIECFWYFSCTDASAALFKALAARAPTARFFTLATGMDSVTRRLLNHPNIIVRCQAPVTRITKDLRVTYGRGERVGIDKFQALVVATTADQARRLVLGDDTQDATASESASLPSGKSARQVDLGSLVPDAVRAFLKTQRYVANVHGVYTVNKALVHEPKEATTVFPCGDGEWPTAAVSFTSHKTAPGTMRPEREGVQVYLMGGASRVVQQEYPRDGDATPLSETTLDTPEAAGHAHPSVLSGIARRVWQHGKALAKGLPAFEQAACVSVFTRKAAIPVPEVGRYKLALAADKSQRGPLVFCGDYLATATVEGALRSGMRAALLVHDYAAESQPPQHK